MTLDSTQPSPLFTHPVLITPDNQSLTVPFTQSCNMASKRKSTVPCMIPSKSKHVREEIILGSLPELLPTIPEDGILSISGEESGHFSNTSSKSESVTQKGGTYSCVSCQFESRDLNYFLDHMHNCHLDFRALPTFYCLNCGVSVVRFEALALHNANAHPKIMAGLVTASLSVNKRDGVTTVEQSLFTNSGEEYRESEISLTKTPIAKMMKAKGEHKKIVVSHTVELRKIDTGKDVDPNKLTNVPELQNGALSASGAPAMLRTTVTHGIATTVSNQVFHQQTPTLYSPLFCDSNKDLPKVMIPLSSIPTYDAAMDTSSFLKTSFGKFPYPTKAELCYLTVVSEFPEEQIKLWFTAQRLKQGISWSPEEIEEARRKMFNTVFQGGAPQKQPVNPRQVNHIVTHHTVTAHPSAKGPNLQMAEVPFGSSKPRPVGVIASPASISTKPQVTRVSYSSLIVPPKFPTVVQTTQDPTKSTERTVEPDKSISLDVAGRSGCARSSSSSNGVENRKLANSSSSPSKGIQSIGTCSASISNNGEHCAADTNNKPNAKINNLPFGSEVSNRTISQVAIENTSKSNAPCNNHNSSAVDVPQLAQAEQPDNKNNNYIHNTNNNSISSEYPNSTCNNSVSSQNYASKSHTETTSTTVITKSNSAVVDVENKNFPIKGMSILQQLIKEDDPTVEDRGGPEVRVDPIKVNIKRLKMNEPEGASEVAYQEPKCEIEVSACHSSFSPPWSNKTPQQVQILRQAFSSTRWPSSLQYENLSIQTGLPKSEVVRWFSDSRYSHKNGQLKWLETYQQAPVEFEDVRGNKDSEAESSQDPGGLVAKKILAEHKTNKRLEGEAGLNSSKRVVWQDSCTPLLALSRSEGADELDGGQKLVQDPWLENGEDDQRPVASQSLIKQQAEANQARDHLRMELLEV